MVHLGVSQTVTTALKIVLYCSCTLLGRLNVRGPRLEHVPHKPGESWNVVCQLIELEEAYPDKFKQRGISPGHEVFQVFADVMELEMGTGRRTGARLRR